MALVLHSLVVRWFERGGWEFVRFPERPWYKRKKEPSFADMLTALRRLSWSEKLAHLARIAHRVSYGDGVQLLLKAD